MNRSGDTKMLYGSSYLQIPSWFNRVWLSHHCHHSDHPRDPRVRRPQAQQVRQRCGQVLAEVSVDISQQNIQVSCLVQQMLK